MTGICDQAIHLCRVRATRVDATGNPQTGANNAVVTDKPISLAVNPDILAGEVKDQKGGCDQLISTYRGQDILKRYNLQLDMGDIEPALEELLTGASVITDGSNGPIGVWFPVPCNFQQPYVAIEGWQDLWDCDHQPSTPFRYVHWIFPSSRWQKGPATLQNDFTLPQFTGFSVANPTWDLGPWGDLPEAAEPNGGWFYTNTIPAGACGYTTVPA